MFGTQAPAQSGQAQNGPDLQDIITEALGFLALAGEAKVQLLPTPWPKDNLPPPTACLLSVASRRGLVAAAGPDSVIVARTASIRKAYEGPRVGDGQIRAFQPELTLPLGMRVSQVAFTADENYLVLSAEQGGGLAVYEVDSILKGSTDSAFQMPTGSQSLRALVPNPTPEKGELLALATMDGKLMVANLKERSFAKGPNGEALTGNVSCISWSARGKQLVAGLGDGSASQFTPEGVMKAQIPCPPNLAGNYHVSSISWLENDVFLMVHNPSGAPSDPAPTSEFTLVSRQKGQHMYQKLGDPSPNFGLNRSPAHHFILRLRDFPPNLKDILLVSSTASTDIGLFTRSAVPLASDKPANEITDVFTMTEMADDSRRAQLPVSDTMEDTSPIGAALDLSSPDPVPRPIPGDEMDNSKTPLPGLLVLNNEGVLASWWVVYNDSVRQGTAYPGLAAAGQQAAAAPAFGTSTASNNAFGGSAFGASSSLSKPSPWGTSSTGAFGTPPASTATPAAPAFGAPSMRPGAFGQPAFGAASTPAVATGGATFGGHALPGQRASPWATGGAAAATPAFGQSSLMSAPAKPAAASAFSAPASGGFAGFATKPSGFAGAAPSSGGSIFGAKPAEASPFGKPAATTSAFGQPAGQPQSTGLFGKPAETTSAFGAPAAQSTGMFGKPAESTSAFGAPAAQSTGLFGKPAETTSAFGAPPAQSTGAFGSGGGFKLGSGFKPDTSSANDNEKPGAAPSLFGSGFGKALGDVREAASVPSPEANMDDDVGNVQPSEPSPAPSTLSKISASTAPATQTGLLFGSKPVGQPQASLASGTSAGFSFGTPATSGATTAAPPSQATTSLFSNLNKQTPAFGAPKQEKSASPPTSASTDAPLPPDFITAKPSKSDDAPLPPDFITAKPSSFSDAPLPPDFTNTKPVAKSPTPEIKSEKSESPTLSDVPKFTKSAALPESDNESEGFSEEEPGAWDQDDEDEQKSHTPEVSPERSQHSPLFGNKRSKPSFDSKPSGGLFGEIPRNSTPMFSPPSQQRDTLRSPSPVRSAIPPHLRGRPDVGRTVSAPIAASEILGNRPPPSKPEFKETLEHFEQEAERREKALKQKEIDEAQALVDEEDERTQAYLQSDLEPTLKLDEFIVHQDYVGDADKDSVPYQVEAVFRDINSMIDTLGMNSRTLKSFMKGHTESYKDEDRTRADLEKPDDWKLDEIKRLSSLIDDDLRKELEDARIHDPVGQMRICTDLTKDAAKLRSRKEEVSALLSTTLDADHAALARTQPLTAEQQTYQHDLRRDFAKLQKQIGEAEEALVLLRTKLASVAGVNGKAAPGPTVEAVLRTVTKMTAMAEKRSGDIDLLENQMRRMRFSSVGRETPERQMSPYQSPMKGSFRQSIAYERPFTPERGATPSRFQQSFSASTRSNNNFSASMRSNGNNFSASMRSNGYGTPSRKKLDGFSKDDTKIIKTKAEKRKEVTELVKKTLEKRGSRVYPMD